MTCSPASHRLAGTARARVCRWPQSRFAAVRISSPVGWAMAGGISIPERTRYCHSPPHGTMNGGKGSVLSGPVMIRQLPSAMGVGGAGVASGMVAVACGGVGSMSAAGAPVRCPAGVSGVGGSALFCCGIPPPGVGPAAGDGVGWKSCGDAVTTGFLAGSVSSPWHPRPAAADRIRTATARSVARAGPMGLRVFPLRVEFCAFIGVLGCCDSDHFIRRSGTPGFAFRSTRPVPGCGLGVLSPRHSSRVHLAGYVFCCSVPAPFDVMEVALRGSLCVPIDGRWGFRKHQPAEPGAGDGPSGVLVS